MTSAVRAAQNPVAPASSTEPSRPVRTAPAATDSDAHPFDTAPTPDSAPTLDTASASDTPTSTTAAAGASGDVGRPSASDGAADVLRATDGSAAPTDTASPLEPPAPTPPVTPVGPIELGHVRDAWPEVLAQLEVASRPSWLVVSTATVRAFDDEVLTLSFRTTGDLNAFKTRTADGGPSEDLRQAIRTVLGVRVKYLARLEGDAPGGPGPAAPPRGPSSPPAGSGARPAMPTGPTSGPRSSAPYTTSVTEWAVAPIPSAEGLPSATATAAAPGGAAHGAVSPAVTTTALAVDDEPDEASPAPGTFAVHPGVVLPPREVTASVPAPDEVDDDDVIPPADDVEAPLPPVVVPRMAPLSGGVQRYGEAVVRQMLGATYVRDEPYEPPTRFS